MTRPYGSFALAPHLMHVGVGGIIPDQNSGTCTAPPQREHVPMVDISLPLPDCIGALDALRVRASPVVCDGIAHLRAPLPLSCGGGLPCTMHSVPFACRVVLFSFPGPRLKRFFVGHSFSLPDCIHATNKRI